MIGFDGDGNVMGGSFGGNIADAMAGTPGAMDGATAESGLGEISGGPGLAGTSIANNTLTKDQTNAKETKSFTDEVLSAMSKFDISSMIPGVGLLKGIGSILGSFVGNTENFNFQNKEALNAGLIAQYTDPLTYDYDTLTQGYPTGPYDEQARQGLISAKMSGFGARKGIATGIDPRTGLHVGPGYPMSEDFFPGYGTNPYSNDPMADPSDPYIRKRRGTEIAAMI
jgi:hypothetical protein|tara:strand:+ start:129 stop:806 length:678 start_codon:yes stop_codon:yes gene_type:complete